MVVAVPVSSVNALIEEELLPAQVADRVGLQKAYKDFRFSGFSMHPVTAIWSGTLSAFQVCDGALVARTITLAQDVLCASPNYLLTTIDTELNRAFEWFLKRLFWVEHDITTCVDPECFC